jgi:hypothetical protein
MRWSWTGAGASIGDWNWMPYTLARENRSRIKSSGARGDLNWTSFSRIDKLIQPIAYVRMKGARKGSPKNRYPGNGSGVQTRPRRETFYIISKNSIFADLFKKIKVYLITNIFIYHNIFCCDKIIQIARNKGQYNKENYRNMN